MLGGLEIVVICAAGIFLFGHKKFKEWIMTVKDAVDTWHKPTAEETKT